MDPLKRLVLVRARFANAEVTRWPASPTPKCWPAGPVGQPLLAKGWPFLARRRPFLAPDCAFVAQHGIQQTSPSYGPGEDR